MSKNFHEFFQKKKFIAGVNIAIVLKHNFPDISCGEHDKEGTAYLKYNKTKRLRVHRVQSSGTWRISFP